METIAPAKPPYFPPQKAKCLNMLHTADKERLVIRNCLALRHISHISGGKHPPKFTVLGKILCEAYQRRHGRFAKAAGRPGSIPQERGGGGLSWGGGDYVVHIFAHILHIFLDGPLG